MKRAKKNGNGNGHLVKYSSYVVVDSDPILNMIWAVKVATKTKNSEIADRADGGVSAGTIARWSPKARKRVRRPQFATVAATACALGLPHLPITADGRREIVKSYRDEG